VSEAKSLAEAVLATGGQLAPAQRVEVLKELRWMVWQSGAIDQALILNKQVLALYRDLHDFTGECIELMMLGVLQSENGDLTAARDALERALRLGREHRVISVIPSVIANLADLEIEHGDLDAAVVRCEESIALVQEFGLPMNAPGYISGYINLAHVANLQARHRDAISFARAALEGAAVRADSDAMSAAFELAWPLAELRQPQRAAELLGAALAYHKYTGATLGRTDKVCEQAARNAISEQLGTTTLQALLERGGETGLEHAVRHEMQHAGEDQHLAS
jgi:tetratricopeptide (TPR) repeat protein